MKNDLEESSIRIKAVTQYLKGTPISEICRQCQRSRAWLYKWIRRYETGNPDWHADHSKSPHTVANKTPDDVIEMVLRLRRDLQETPGFHVGAKSIQARLMILGWDRLSLRTINRILKQNQLSGQRRPLKPRKSRRRKPTTIGREQPLLF